MAFEAEGSPRRAITGAELKLTKNVEVLIPLRLSIHSPFSAD